MKETRWWLWPALVPGLVLYLIVSWVRVVCNAICAAWEDWRDWPEEE